jgi:hypothetical protein
MLKQATEAYEAALHLRGWPRLKAQALADSFYLDALANRCPANQKLMVDVLRLRVDWLKGEL